MARYGLAVLAVCATLAFPASSRAVDTPAEQDGRIWLYGNYTAVLSPNWSVTVMPGIRFEYARWDKPNLPAERQFYMYELFAGPNYLQRFGNLTVKGSAWYYYTGYANRAASTASNTYSYYNAHHIEVIPAVDYKIGRFSILDRVILHNTVYADYYRGSSQRWGYGLVLRELIQVRYAVTDKVGVSLGDEPFFGLVEDGDTKNLVNANGAKTGYHPYGFWKQGLRLNRIYAGVDIKVHPMVAIAPMYVFETNLSPTDSSDVTSTGHYLFLTVSFVQPHFNVKK